ncbi:MAG TPA: carboxypeptidase regulatory-like domain-containing protein [Kofleriaceae bacterium]|nr:carboxypeptidase regulatory-like domain-containing protein [Kofleriaceae bacterium]
MAPVSRKFGLVVALLGAGASAAHGDDGAQTVGDAGGALPGLVRVGAATEHDGGLVLTALTGYGFRGATIADEDRHHRAALDLGASYRPLPWLAVSARFSGRYDRHTATGAGKDGGWVGDPRLAARAAFPLSPALTVGGHLGLWIPGEDAPSATPSATTVDAIGLVSWRAPSGRLVLVGQAGYRLDNSAESAPDAALLSPSDRMALGVSDFDALLVGAGAATQVGSAEVFGEWSMDLLVGDGAPGAGESPMRVGGGARLRLTPAILAQATAEVSLSSTPDAGAMDPLVPIDPRFVALAGITIELDLGAGRGGGDGDGEVIVDRPPPPVPPRTGGASIAVTGADGAPMAGAEVTLEPAPGPDGAPRAPMIAETDAEGRATFEEVPLGHAKLVVRHPDHEASELEIDVRAGEVATAPVSLERALPPGQLRGGVRSFDGKPLQAKLTVAPLGTVVKCDERGEFSLDLPPGAYEVSVEAPGHRAQKRAVKIEQDGVTILNVDLRR